VRSTFKKYHYDSEGDADPHACTQQEVGDLELVKMQESLSDVGKPDKASRPQCERPCPVL